MTKRTDKGSGKRHAPLIVSIIVVVVLVAAAGGFFFLHEKNVALDRKIQESQQLVAYNPLADGPAAKQLKAVLPKPGVVTPQATARAKASKVDLTKLYNAAKTEIDGKQRAQMGKQKSSLSEVNAKLKTLEKDKNFPSDSRDDVSGFNDLATMFENKSDAVGLNLSVTGLQALAGETTTFIKKQTAAQKAQAQAMQAAITNKTYPSLGMLRGDMANGIGVLPMYLLSDGPAEEAGLQTMDDWDDSSVITGIDGKPVESAIIGAHSMQKVLQTIPLHKKVEVQFLDGSTKRVDLSMTERAAEKEAQDDPYPDLPDPGDDTDTDIDFGASGYNIGQKHNDKEIGLYVTGISAGSSLDDTDIKNGDIICRIDDYFVGDTTDIDKIMSNYESGDTVTVDYVTSGGHLKSTDIDLTD